MMTVPPHVAPKSITHQALNEPVRASQVDHSGRVAYADAMRAVAIFAVVLFHVIGSDRLFFRGAAHTFGYLGIWGVDCFFVLTGFLLGKPFFHAIVDGFRLPSSRLYAARRFLRIYPLYAVFLLAVLADLALSHRAPSTLNVLAHVTMTHAFFPPYIMSINGPLWTIAVDTQFYFVLPIAAFIVARAVAHRSRPGRINAIWNVLLGTAIFSVAYRFVVAHAMTSFGEPSYDPLYVWLRNLPGMGIDFAIGCGLALLSIASPNPTRSRAWYGMSALAGVLLFIGVSRCQELSTHAPLWSMALGFAMQDVIGGLSAGLILYGTIRGDFAWLRRIVSSRIVATLAALAYAVYLVHLPVLGHVLPLYQAHLGTVRGALEILTATLIPVMILAYIAHRFIERPVLSLRDRQREAAPYANLPALLET